MPVPVRTARSGVDVVRFHQDPMGGRVAVGFTSPDQLRTVLGPDQGRIVMAESCLRETVAGLGVDMVVRDPRMTARPVGRRARTREGATSDVEFDDSSDGSGDADEADGDVPRCSRHIPRNDER